MSSPEQSFILNEDKVERTKFFARYVQAFSNLFATKLKGNAPVAYLVYVMLMNCSANYRLWLSEHGQAVVSFLRVRICTNLKDGFSTVLDRSSVYWFTETDEVLVKKKWWLSSQLNIRQKMMLRHDAVLEILRRVLDTGFASLEGEGEKKNVWNCFPVVVSYCYHLPETKGMSYVMHKAAVRRPFVGCTVNMEDIRDLQGGIFQASQTKFSREQCA